MGAVEQELDQLRRALVEAARCPRCKGAGEVRGRGWRAACGKCDATGIRSSLSNETQVVAAKAKEALDG